MDGDFHDPNYNMPPIGYGYPHDGFDYNQPMDYSHDPGYDFHQGDPALQPLAHPPPRGGTWYDTDLWSWRCKPFLKGFFELLIFLPWGRPEHWAVVLQRARITRERIACSTVLSFQDFWSRTLSCYLQAMLYSLSMSVAFPVYNVKFYKTGFLNPLSKWSWDWETFVKTSILLLSSFTVLCTFE